MELGFGEILVVLVIVLLVFGPSKLPRLGEALGKSIRNFKQATEGAGADGASDARPEQRRLAAGGPSEVTRTPSAGEPRKAP